VLDAGGSSLRQPRTSATGPARARWSDVRRAGGHNCEFGGIKIETGLDANNDGVLDASEVNAAATTFACNTSPSGTTVATKGINIIVGTGDVSTSTTGPITPSLTACCSMVSMCFRCVMSTPMPPTNFLPKASRKRNLKFHQ
jgi:hypothetical protein